MHIYRGRALWGLLVNAADVQGSRPWGFLVNAADDAICMHIYKGRENTYFLHDFIKHVHLVCAGSEDKRGVELLTCIFCMQM